MSREKVEETKRDKDKAEGRDAWRELEHLSKYSSSKYRPMPGAIGISTLLVALKHTPNVSNVVRPLTTSIAKPTCIGIRSDR